MHCTLPPPITIYHIMSSAHCVFKACRVIKCHNCFSKQYAVHAPSLRSPPASSWAVTEKSLRAGEHMCLGGMCDRWQPALTLMERTIRSVGNSGTFNDKQYGASHLLEGPQYAPLNAGSLDKSDTYNIRMCFVSYSWRAPAFIRCRGAADSFRGFPKVSTPLR
jgi:hypothetical protein